MAPPGSSQVCSPAEVLHPSQGEPLIGADRASQMRGFSVWFVALWNVRTLVDVEGSVETARHDCDASVMDERKTDQVVSELDRYHVVVAALQETKWLVSSEGQHSAHSVRGGLGAKEEWLSTDAY